MFNHASSMPRGFIYSFCQMANIDWPDTHIDYVPDTVEEMRQYKDE